MANIRKKVFPFWREIRIQVLVILLQLYFIWIFSEFTTFSFIYFLINFEKKFLFLFSCCLYLLIVHRFLSQACEGKIELQLGVNAMHAWRSRATTCPQKWIQLCSCQQPKNKFSENYFLALTFSAIMTTFLFYFFRFFLASTLDWLVEDYQEDTAGFIKGQ